MPTTLHLTLERLLAVEVLPTLDGVDVDHDRLVTALAEVEPDEVANLDLACQALAHVGLSVEGVELV
ncbi:hypothetical protein [Aestuariimicrobium kwangyangense]|uniref:hypothetical protein n=1 Tax=Aestuariimicrobium kwangyangense TaxID=396389 RepID=UPI0003B770EF|nr:hypothetical protein [Aestuariimicrobium kwangyangense]